MKWKHILYYILLLAGCVVLGKLLRSLVIGLGDSHDITLEYYTKVSVSVMIIAGCWLIAKKLSLVRIGGFRGGRPSNYWMLLLPLLFPGILMFKVKNYHCLDATLFSFIIIFSKLVAATMEEALFRGVILGHLQKNYPERSVHFYCFVSATFFSLVHLTNLQTAPLNSVIPQLVYAFILGLLFAVMMLRIQNVWLLGITHGILNIMTANVCKEILGASPVSDADASENILLAVMGFLLYLLPVLVMYILLANSFRRETALDNKTRNSVQSNQD